MTAVSDSGWKSLLTIGSSGVKKMSNGNGNKREVSEDVAHQILEELWKYTFSEGCRSMGEAHDDWWGKSPSVWPIDVKQNIALKGVLDLLADTRRSISEAQDIIRRIDKDIGYLKKDVCYFKKQLDVSNKEINRDDILKQQLEVDERRSNDKTES